MELGYLGYGGTRVSMILWNKDIQNIVELGYLGYGEIRISRIRWTMISRLLWKYYV